MKELYIIANWKANKTEQEAIDWLEKFASATFPAGVFEHKEVILCPPSTVFPQLKQSIRQKNVPITLGAQDISQFGRGAYTGEIPAALLREYASYVIIGHSERKTYFNESDETAREKVGMAVGAGISPVFCVQSQDTPVPNDVWLVAYEPVSAIGTGNPDTPENANEVARKIKQANKSVKHVLYGGSVNSENVKTFTSMESIDGVLVGGTSLDAGEFCTLIQHA